MSHANAALTPKHRLIVARLVIDQGMPICEVAARFQVSWPTVKRWAERYRAGESMLDRSSRPHHSPTKTPQQVVKRCVSLRLRLRESPVQLAARLGIAASTVGRILTACRLNRLSACDRATGEPIRRYEHDHPGSLVHVDVKKLGNIPDGGGWRFVGRQQGNWNRQNSRNRGRNAYGQPRLGHAFVHSVIDDHSRVVYSEVHDDETALTATGVLARAVDWFAARGITIERVLSDNGSAYKSHLWQQVCDQLGITVKKTRPRRPQTNGKIERFHRTLADGWAYARCYTSEQERRNALNGWIHYYNHHRPHSACSNQPPITRLTNLPGQYTLRPLPTMHKDLSEESRVRRRYVDLIVRDEAREMVRKRSAITRAVRETLYAQDYLEVETPILQLLHGGAAARPFGTHLNAFDIDMSLRIALELHLKRTMVGGASRVFEMGRVFRNEGVDSSHSPEFTMLEAYEAWGDQFSVGKLTQEIVLAAADAVGTRQIETPQGTIDLDGEWPWVSVYPRLSEEFGREITVDTPADELRALADERGVEVDPAWDAGKLVMELFGEIVEPTLIQPTFVCDYPAVAQPLARINKDDPGKVLAWDLIIGGMERGTGFTEMIDPVIQRDVLTAQSLKAAAGDPEAMQLDTDFIEALEYGVPPMGGLGIGIDRLIMLLTGAGIRETILYPLLRPHS